MDVLNPALQRKSVAVIPTSTSAGADACLVEPGINDVQDLKKTKTYGLSESVSQYVFIRCLELAGAKYADYQFANLDPGEAAKNMQARSKGTDAIMVWNPFLLQTLKLRPDVKVLFDSSRIPEEVIDMVVIGEDVLNQPGGKEFACALIDCYYEFNKLLQDPAQRDELLVALGKRFSSLNLEEMKKATTQTRFYKTPEEGLALFGNDKFHKRMARIVDLYGQLKIIKGKPPTFGFGSADQVSAVNLRFDPTFIQMVKDKK
jgi:NitT/TauT family transport system substrate-binding protein